MGKFLRENWLWIVLPLVLALTALVGAILFFEDDAVSPFLYDF